MQSVLCFRLETVYAVLLATKINKSPNNTSLVFQGSSQETIRETLFPTNNAFQVHHRGIRMLETAGERNEKQ